MVVISIVGAPGVGKSLLVRQLAALNNLPCFLEGEEGVLSEELLEKIAKGNDPINQFSFFIKKYKINLARADKIKGFDVLVDGDFISIESHILEKDKSLQKELYKLFPKRINLKHKVFLLTAEKEFFEKSIKNRARKFEEVNEFVRRSLSIQEKFLQLSKKYKIIEIKRSSFDFQKNKDLEKINKIIFG
jgi:deoxyadenosine/deoxycytidine kinase